MQFCDFGPDVPETLIRDQLAGEVVLVVGAGVSRRIGLPLFADLVKCVYAKLGQAIPGTPNSLASAAEAEAWEAKQWDRTLGLLEQRLVYPDPHQPTIQNPVRSVVSDVLGSTPRRPRPHRDILTISRDALGRGRVVTTNFDLLFERAARNGGNGRIGSWAGPGLPVVGSTDFHGVMHLHGRFGNARLGVPSSNLILTSADFGEAYLRSGWASRFVYDLLRRYTLVFVGYGADDPPMRYMLEATEAGRLHFPDLRTAYAFASFGESPEWDEGSGRARWRAKGLVPILYENADLTHDCLYQTLTAWAECSRDSGAWASKEIARIASGQFEQASSAARAKAGFLARAMANVSVLSEFAGSPDWIEALIETRSPPQLDDRDALVWLGKRLNDFETARWALKVKALSLRGVIARAVRRHLALEKGELQKPLNQYWHLYIAAFFPDESLSGGTHRLTVPIKLSSRVTDYSLVQSVVEVVRPRLQMRPPLPSMWRAEELPEPREPELSDLCELEFHCSEWPTWPELLSHWPETSDAEYRLLKALERALAEACELARDANRITTERDWISREVQLVHELDAVEAGVPSSREGFTDSRWQEFDPDQHNDSFVPIVRLMSGLWRRLASRGERRARNIARGWIDQDFALFQRLGYWAASVSDTGPATIAGETLAGLSVDAFWLEHRTAEATRFWCRRWNELPTNVRRAIENDILKGPKSEWMWLAETKKDKRLYADRRRYDELIRIKTAGGVLSRRAESALVRLAAKIDNPPSQISAVERLRHTSWSGWGYGGDTSLVAEVPTERLLDHVTEIAASDPINQDGLWRAVCEQRPADALAALVQAGTEGRWPVDMWRDYLNGRAVAFKAGVDEQQVKDTASTVCEMPEDTLASLLPSSTLWLESVPAKEAAGTLREVVLKTWDQLVDVLSNWKEPSERSASRDRHLLEESVNHPAGKLASILIAIQDTSPKEADIGLAADIEMRIERLTRLPMPLRRLALAPLIRALAFFQWLAPDWTEKTLFQEFKRDDTDAKEYLATLVLYGVPFRIQIFNRLKSFICSALTSADTADDVRNHLAHVITWAIGTRMAGDDEIDITEMEARRLLTLAPSTALRSVAWGLWRSLADPRGGDAAAEWQRRIRPLLERVWPNDVIARSPEVSRMLIEIPAAAGEQLPDAVRVVSPLIVPSEIRSVEFDFGIHGHSELIKRSPNELFDLVYAAVDVRNGMPYDLAKFLDDIGNAVPSLKVDSRYVTLRSATTRLPPLI